MSNFKKKARPKSLATYKKKLLIGKFWSIKILKIPEMKAHNFVNEKKLTTQAYSFNCWILLKREIKTFEWDGSTLYNA